MKKYRTVKSPYIEIKLGDQITIVKEEESKFGGKRIVTEKIKVTEDNLQTLINEEVITEIKEEKPVDTLISLIKEAGQALKKHNPILSYINISNSLKALYSTDKGAFIKLILKQYANNRDKYGLYKSPRQNWRYSLDRNGAITILNLSEIQTFETDSYFFDIKEVTKAQKLFLEMFSSPYMWETIDKAFDKLIADDL